MPSQLFLTKSHETLLEELRGENRLRRVLGPVQLSSLGVGAIIGTGIFVLTGVAAHDLTGPALMLSFVVSGITCVFAALCYAEFASMVPVAGSAYTYAYATLGELFAWIIGWDLILEYAVASATVAHGWSHYFQDFLSFFHIGLPHAFTNAPFDYDLTSGRLMLTGTWFDLPAIVIAALVTIVLVKGIRESASLNTAIVILKLAIVFFVIGVGAFYVNPANWRPFAPFGLTGLSFFGHTVMGRTGPAGAPVGMLAGAAIVFFAYIGFDSISTHAEEARNPSRDVPIGIHDVARTLHSPVYRRGRSTYRNGAVQSDQYRRSCLRRIQAGGPAVGATADFDRGHRGHHLGAPGDDVEPAENLFGDGAGRFAAHRILRARCTSASARRGSPRS